MLRNEQPFPFEIDPKFWDKIQPPPAAGIVRNLLQRRALLRLSADDVIKVNLQIFSKIFQNYEFSEKRSLSH